MGIWVVPSFWLLWKKFCYQHSWIRFFADIYFHFSWRCPYLRKELLSYFGNSITFWESPNCFPKWLNHFTLIIQWMSVPISLHHHWHIFHFLILSHCHPLSDNLVCEWIALPPPSGTSSRGGAEASCHCPYLGSIMEMGPFTYLRDPESAFRLNTGITTVMLCLGSPSLLPDRRPGLGLGLLGHWSWCFWEHPPFLDRIWR